MVDMGKNVDFRQFEQFAKKLEKTLSDQARQKFMEDCVKELAARLLSRVIKRTPSKTGLLRRGWTASSHREAELTVAFGGGDSQAGHLKGIDVVKKGNTYEITIENSVDYSSYVEYGHRREPGIYIPEYGKSTTAGWTDGQFFLTISEQEVEKLAPALLEKRLMEMLKEAFK